MRSILKGLFNGRCRPHSQKRSVESTRYCLSSICRVGVGLRCVPSLSALVGTAFLAYSLGLRHAVDADHIAAIDNVTRS